MSNFDSAGNFLQFFHKHQSSSLEKSRKYQSSDFLPRKILPWFFAVMLCAFVPQKSIAQLYFFDGFTDAAVPGSWYDNVQGLGAGFTGANFAGQNLVVLGGRHAVVNSTMDLSGGTITIQPGGQLTVVAGIINGGTITVNGGGILRIEGNPNIGGLALVTYNSGSILYFTGSTTRDVFALGQELPAFNNANVIFNNTSANGVRLNTLGAMQFNGQVTVSSGTLQLENSTVTFASTLLLQSGGVIGFGAGTPTANINNSVGFSGGNFNAVSGNGVINVGGSGGITGDFALVTGTNSATSLPTLNINRIGLSFTLGNTCNIDDLTLAANTSLTIPQSRTLTLHGAVSSAASSAINVSGTLIYTDGLGAVGLSGGTNVLQGGVLQIQATGFGGTGTISVNEGARLRTNSPLLAATPVDYSTGTTLEYFGTNLIATPGPEFVNPLRGNLEVTVSGAGQVQLNGSYTIRGNLAIAPAGAVTQAPLVLMLNSSVTLKGRIVTQNNIPTFGIQTPDQSTTSITIDSNDTTPITNFSITPINALSGSAVVQNFTLNRPTTLSLRGNLVIGPETPYDNIITPFLRLQRGIIIPPVGSRVIMLSSNATSLVGGSTSAHIQGVFQRTLRTSASTYLYPVGANGRYMPLSIINPITTTPLGDATPGVAITPQINVQGGTSATAGQIASFAPSGRVWTASLTSLTGLDNFRVQVQDTNLVSSNVLTTSTASGGDYSILPATLQSNAILVGTTPQSIVLNTPTRVFRVGNTVPAPNIAFVSPVVVGSGATVLISGSNFLGVTQVTFGPTTVASFNVLSPTQISAVIPGSALPNPGDNVNAVSVRLGVTAQGGSTASVTTLTFVLPPTVTNFLPNIGNPGAAVRIFGTRLGGALYNTPPTVLFGGNFPAQSVTVVNPNEIVAIVPRNATTGTLRIITPGGTAATISTFTFVPPPRITDIQPSVAPEGTVISIFGSGFVNPSAVRLGGVNTQFTPNSQTRISAVVSTGATGFVEIFTPSGVITSATIFTFAPRPRVSSARPLVTGTGSTIEINGFGFVGEPLVEFGSVSSASVVIASISTMRVEVPRSLAPGTYPIRVTTPGGVATSTFSVTVVPSPVIAGFEPPSGTTGTIVRISGRNFTVSTVTNVSIAGVTAASFRVISDSLIIAEAGRIATDGTIRVTALGGTGISTSVFANIAPPPIISALRPIEATVGTVVSVLGENFNDANVFQIVNADVILNVERFEIVTNGQITFTVPANATSGTIVVGTSGGFARSPQPFRFLGPPSISLVEPSFGLPGTTFVIRGDNLNGTRQVLIGQTSVARIQQDSPTQITVTLDTASPLGFDLPITIGAEQGSVRINNLFSIVTGVQADSLALVEIYRRTVGSGWRQSANWLTLRPISQWLGVSTATAVADSAIRGRVIGLSLPQNNMLGSLPVALQFLTELRVLNLSNNPLAGLFPRYIGNFTKLEMLQLGNMRLTGGLSDSIGLLRNLKVLEVSNNQLSGLLPRVLTQNTQLEQLNLSSNRFADSIPAFLSGLTRLQTIKLDNNQLTGTLPASYSRLSQTLSEFDVSNNQISGTIPEAYSALRNLTTFAVANNRLSGQIPAQTLRPLENLRTLNLGGNRFVGVVPPELSQLRRLRFLSVRRNLLEGSIPDVLSSLDSLETLLLDSNSFIGAVPATFENFNALARLNVGGNRLTALPNLLRIRQLNNLNVAANRLDFGSLEPVALIDTLLIVPQDSIGESRRIGGIISIPVRLALSASGSANRYQWFRQTPQGDVPVSAVLRDSVFLFPFTSSSSGTYICRVTNTLPELRSLTLFSRPIRVDSAGIPAAPREVPEPIFPIDSISNITTTATVLWTRTTDASVFDVQFVTGRDTLSISQADTNYRLPGVRFETEYQWRVRGRNITGFTAWSAWNVFTTIGRNVEISGVIPRFPRTAVGDRVERNLALTSNTTATILIESVAITDPEANFELVSELGANFPLQPGASVSVPIRFFPKTAGRKAATITIRYRTSLAGAVRVLQLTNVAQGDATPLKIVDTDFNLVRVNKRTLAAVLLINRLPRVVSTSATASNNNVITIRSVDIENNLRGSFSLVGFQSPMYLGGGDTTAIIVRCEPTQVGRIAARLRITTEVASSNLRNDFSTGNISAEAILQDTADFFAEVALRPMRGRERGFPGSTTFLEVFYTRARLPAANNTSIPLLQFIFGSIRFDRNVLSLLPTPLAESQPNSAPLNNISRSLVFSNNPRIFSTANRPARQDSVLIDSIPCRVVVGAVPQTQLLIEQLSWGLQTSRRSKIFIEEAPVTSTFTTEISGAGGQRFIVPTPRPNLALTSIQPNPAGTETTVVFTLAEKQNVFLEILDIQGQLVRTLELTGLSAGEHNQKLSLSGLASGSYVVRLKGQSGNTVSEKLNVIR